MSDDLPLDPGAIRNMIGIARLLVREIEASAQALAGEGASETKILSMYSALLSAILAVSNKEIHPEIEDIVCSVRRKP